MKKNILIFTASILFAIGCSTDAPRTDLVLFNGKIVTLDDSLHNFEALAVRGDTICALGSSKEIQNMIGERTRVIDLKGKLVIPGIIESHAHFLSLGKAKMKLELQTARNWDEIIAMVSKKAESQKPGEWILGRGWHQEKWDPEPVPSVEGYPIHDVLSEASPNNPVLLTHASGHAIFANKKAMEMAGITDSTKDPEGGRIVRDSKGKAIGVFEEEAENLIEDVYNKYFNMQTAAEIKEYNRKAAILADRECLSKGITTLHDAGETFKKIDMLKEFVDSADINLRLYVMLYDTLKNYKNNISDYKIIGYANNHLTVRAVKLYIDGALGSRGAWLLDPYEDLPGYSGLNVTPLDEIEQTADIAVRNGFQVCTHAIGDKGNRIMLNIYESIFKRYPDHADLRWRIEHAQHLSEKEIPRFSELGVIAAMQGIHCTSDAVFVLKRLGVARAEEGAYVWRKLLDHGTIICNGTDAPIEDVDPIKCFYASVTRKLPDGSSFFPDQKMTRIEALKSYTLNGAYAGFEESLKGSLEIGKLADITVLSKDILIVPEDQIPETRVVYTIVGGKVLYEAEVN